MPTHAPRPTVCLRWILATCLGACVGTPTPEPPDNLPRPKDSLIFADSVAVTETTGVLNLPPIPVAGGPGSVAPSSELWVINLDRTNVAPRTITALPNGSFNDQISAQLGDRVRLISRTNTQHSLPLDAQVVMGFDEQAQLAQLPNVSLPCLSIEPEDERTSVVRDGKQALQHFTLRSTCDEAITLDARLRFGDAGFAIEAPSTLAANSRTTLTVRIDGHDDVREHADIVLLDAETSTRRGRYALGVWSVAESSLE